MSALYVLLPVAVAFAAGAVALFLWAVRDGQLDDLDTPALRMLHDDDEAPPGPPGIKRAGPPGRSG